LGCYQGKVEMSLFLQSGDVPFCREWSAEREPLCGLRSFSSLAGRDKLTSQTISVFDMGKHLLNGFAIEMTTIMVPGVIRGRWLGDFDLTIESLGIHNFSLAEGLLVGGLG
jgi:hypothetical protein